MSASRDDGDFFCIFVSRPKIGRILLMRICVIGGANVDITGGDSLDSNIQLVLNNARLAARTAALL